MALSSTRHSKSNPIELNFNRTQSNSIGGLSSIEFGNRTISNSPKKKNQSNPIERSIFELVIYVKQTLKIHYQILEARVTSALSVALSVALTVILLREVLMEMGVSFKSSESKANLIEKVTQARQMQNDTCDDNGLVTVTSTHSLNLHTEELREVPENSISSPFFHKNNALSTSSGTLLRARGKITLDTEELNVHEHLIHLI